MDATTRWMQQTDDVAAMTTSQTRHRSGHSDGGGTLQVRRGHHAVYMHKGTAILQYLRHGDAEMPPGAARKTGLDQSHTGLDQSKPEPVLTSLWTVQDRSGLVHIGLVRFFWGVGTNRRPVSVSVQAIWGEKPDQTGLQNTIEKYRSRRKQHIKPNT
jgi:hypothetical protein